MTEEFVGPPEPRGPQGEVAQPFEDALDEGLFHADPNCNHWIYSPRGGGIRCVRCSGWFCY